CKLDCVDVITQRLVDLNRFSPDARIHLRVEIIVDHKIALEDRIVRHRTNILLPNAIGTHVMSKRNVLLQNHAIRSARVVFFHQLLPIVYPRDSAPAASVKRLDECRKSYVINDTVPIQRVFEVSERFRYYALFVLLLWEQDRFRNSDPQVGGQRVVEELVIGVPPEWIVDYFCAAKNRALQIRSIERHLVRYPIDNRIVRTGFGHPNSAKLYVLSLGRGVAAIYFTDQSLRKSAFAPHENTNFHRVPPKFTAEFYSTPLKPCNRRFSRAERIEDRGLTDRKF